MTLTFGEGYRSRLYAGQSQTDPVLIEYPYEVLRPIGTGYSEEGRSTTRFSGTNLLRGLAAEDRRSLEELV